MKKQRLDKGLVAIAAFVMAFSGMAKADSFGGGGPSPAPDHPVEESCGAKIRSSCEFTGALYHNGQSQVLDPDGRAIVKTKTVNLESTGNGNVVAVKIDGKARSNGKLSCLRYGTGYRIMEFYGAPTGLSSEAFSIPRPVNELPVNNVPVRAGYIDEVPGKTYLRIEDGHCTYTRFQ